MSGTRKDRKTFGLLVAPKAGTRQHRVLSELCKGATLTVPAWIDMTGSWSLTPLISNLRDMGWEIETAMIDTCGSHQIARYTLSPEMQDKARELMALRPQGGAA